ncbi:MAG: hypothetical protein JNK76_21785 [Planctomycetales bacterium]|nr:hypothetical protein [Planctomycetales bacterium]MBN8625110.1 hypothetical protein [Planctomycetota bacterium]
MPRIALIVAPLAFASYAAAAAPEAAPPGKPEPQYQFEQIRIEVPRADEPLAKTVSVAKAQEYLEQGATAWTGHRKCVACHTNGLYMTVRPALAAQLGTPDAAQRSFLVDTLRKKQNEAASNLKRGTTPEQLIYLAAGLAEWDRHVTGKLSPETDEALRIMFTIQRDDGSWAALDCWPPYESDSYHPATVAAMAVATAPDWLANLKDEATLAGIAKLKNYLRKTPPPHDYGRVLLLWAALRMPDLLDDARRRELVDQLARHQRPDGGWSIRNFAEPEQWGKGNRAEKLRAEPEFTTTPSDGHMTGLAVVVLREAGVPKNDPRLKKAVAWLKSNQRESGVWWTRSLNTDKFHFITYSSTAFPLLALAMCDELPKP